MSFPWWHPLYWARLLWTKLMDRMATIVYGTQLFVPPRIQDEDIDGYCGDGVHCPWTCTNCEYVNADGALRCVQCRQDVAPAPVHSLAHYPIRYCIHTAYAFSQSLHHYMDTLHCRWRGPSTRYPKWRLKQHLIRSTVWLATLFATVFTPPPQFLSRCTITQTLFTVDGADRGRCTRRGGCNSYHCCLGYSPVVTAPQSIILIHPSSSSILEIARASTALRYSETRKLTHVDGATKGYVPIDKL
jgi:hypothetical protein